MATKQRQQASNEQLEALIESIKKGDAKATKTMLNTFSPLVRKTCATLYRRYNGLISMDDLLYNGNHLLIYLVCMEYKKNGAHIPQFLKILLHARLVQYCRPILAYRRRVVELKDYVPDPKDPRHTFYKMEREAIIIRINDFMWRTFNDRERDIVINHMIRGMPRNKIAAHYGVSKMRMKVIHKRVQEKLRKFLDKFGIKSINDI